MNIKNIQKLKQTFEKLTPNDIQKAKMLRIILKSSEKKKKRFVMKPLFTAAGLLLIIGGVATGYNIVKRDNYIAPNTVNIPSKQIDEIEEAITTQNTTFTPPETIDTSSTQPVNKILDVISDNPEIDNIFAEFKNVIENNKDSFNGKYNGEFNEEIKKVVEKIQNYANSSYFFYNETLASFEITEELTEDFRELADKYLEFQTELLKIYGEYDLFVPFDIPLKSEYYITTEWGKDLWSRNYGHLGVDLAVEKGTEIYAAADGVVSEEMFNENNDFWNSGYGLCVVLEHGNSISTMYAHCSEVLVEKGQEVKKGDLIARVGDTGWATGPHLHFEFRIFNLSFNPRVIIDV